MRFERSVWREHSEEDERATVPHACKQHAGKHRHDTQDTAQAGVHRLLQADGTDLVDDFMDPVLKILVHTPLYGVWWKIEPRGEFPPLIRSRITQRLIKRDRPAYLAGIHWKEQKNITPILFFVNTNAPKQYSNIDAPPK